MARTGGWPAVGRMRLAHERSSSTDLTPVEGGGNGAIYARVLEPWGDCCEVQHGEFPGENKRIGLIAKKTDRHLSILLPNRRFHVVMSNHTSSMPIASVSARLLVSLQIPDVKTSSN